MLSAYFSRPPGNRYLYDVLCLLARPNSCFREQYSTISTVFVTSRGDLEGKNVFPGRCIDMKRAKALSELAIGHDHFIVHQHLSQVVQPVRIEIVFLLDHLDALTQRSIGSLQSIFVEPEDVDVFGGTGCMSTLLVSSCLLPGARLPRPLQ